MNNEDKSINNTKSKTHDANSSKGSGLENMEELSQYLKSTAGTRQGRTLPPLEKWHPTQVEDMDLVIKDNGEWWHEGTLMTRESLVNLFATVLWKEEDDGIVEYFLKTPGQKLRIKVEDVPFLINDVGIVQDGAVQWLEFTTTTGDVIRLDDDHPISLRTYLPSHNSSDDKKVLSQNDQSTVRPYLLVRNGMTALIGRSTFYHLTEIGELTEQNDETTLTLQSGGRSYKVSMPTS